MNSERPGPAYALPVYTDIDTDIERLCRVFLDVKLMELRYKSADLDKYRWSALRFRCQHLCPVETLQAAYKDACKNPALSLDPSDLDPVADQETIVYFRPYLYWFDVRAEYWSHRKPIPPFPIEDLETQIIGILRLAESLRQKTNGPKDRPSWPPSWGDADNTGRGEDIPDDPNAKGPYIESLKSSLQAMRTGGRSNP